MRWLVYVCVVVAACDSGTKAEPPPPPVPAAPVVVAPPDAAVAEAPPDPVPAAPTAPPDRVPLPVPSDAATAALVKQLQAMRRSKKGPGLCAATTVEKTCATDADCAFVSVITDQCRTTFHIGVSASAGAALQARLVDPCARNPCPACVVRWMITEDCMDSGDAVVSCVKGRCLTRTEAR